MEIYIELPKDIQSIIAPLIYQYLHEIKFSKVLKNFNYNYDHYWGCSYSCYYCAINSDECDLYKTISTDDFICLRCEVTHDDTAGDKLTDNQKIERYRKALLQPWYRRVFFLKTTECVNGERMVVFRVAPKEKERTPVSGLITHAL